MTEECIWPIKYGMPDTNDNSILSYHVLADGIYCKKSVFDDKYVFFKQDNISGFPRGKEQLHPIEDNKIPVQLLWDTIALFKKVVEKFKEPVEAFVIYGYDRVKSKYFIWVPFQEVSGGEVEYNNLARFYTDNPNSYIVADAHQAGAFA